MSQAQPLVEKVAVVTGGGRGIGRAISLKLASLGATVVANYSKSSADAESLVDQIVSAGGKASAVQFDVSKEAEVEAGFAKILDQYGTIGVLVNNAGIAVDGLLMRTKTADWERTLGVNLTSAFLCSRAVTKPMIKSRWGRIINISSIIGEIGNAGQAAYSASKSGLFGLTKSMARELASRNITVNAVTPGYVITDMTSSIGDEQTKAMLANIPLGRLGTVDDIAFAVAMLAHPDASYITGQVIGVNGGMHM